MPTINVTTRTGDTRAIDARFDLSIMENLRDGGIDENFALCGGCLSCGTCHVFIDDQLVTQLPPISEDEDDLLDLSDTRQANSRLSCQLPLTEQLDGIVVTVAPED